LQFAGIALIEEIFHTEKSVEVLYYLAVINYLTHQYKDSLSYLKEAESIYGLVRAILI
jgi:hypothetical protein